MKTGSAVTYRAFTRTWWRNNDSGEWSNGLEPCPGRKTTIGRRLTEDEARRLCKAWNAGHRPGRLSRKAEYEQE